MAKMTLENFKENFRDAVLEALDEKVRELLEHEDARGWTDAELPALLKAVDAHAEVVAKRINAGEEPGSMNLTIEMDQEAKKPIHSIFVSLSEANKALAKIMFAGAGANDGFYYELDGSGVVWRRRRTLP